MIQKMFVRWILAVLFTGLIAGCSILQQVTQVQKPVVDVADVHLSRLSLDGVDLVFDLRITNPNPLEINLAGFDYDFFLNASSFIKGDQQKPVSIPSRGTGHVEIPISLTFQNIYETYQSLKNSDSTDYAIHAGLTFDLPVIGPYRIPVQTSGRLPLVKIPKISIVSFRIVKMGLMGADLEFNCQVDNPNPFSFLINAFDYDLKINGANWAKGKSENRVNIQQKDKSRISIPVSLDFLQMGQTVAGLLKGDAKLNYQFTGGLDLESPASLIGKAQLPFDLTGTVGVTR